MSKQMAERIKELEAKAEQLAAQCKVARHERDRAQSQRDALRSVLDQVANFITSRQVIAMELVATPSTAPDTTGDQS